MNKYDAAQEAIRELHGDTSKSMKETLSDLKGLRDELDILIEVVELDVKQEESP